MSKSTFTFKGKKYDLYKVKQEIQNKEVKMTYVSQLKKELKRYKINFDRDKQKIRSANLKNPILVIKWKGEWYVLDGIYKLAKAVAKENRYVLTTYVSQQNLRDSRVDISQPVRDVYTVGDVNQMDDPNFKYIPKRRPVWLTYQGAYPYSNQVTVGGQKVPGAVYLVRLPRGIHKDAIKSQHSWFVTTRPAKILRKVKKGVPTS